MDRSMSPPLISSIIDVGPRLWVARLLTLGKSLLEKAMADTSSLPRQNTRQYFGCWEEAVERWYIAWGLVAEGGYGPREHRNGRENDGAWPLLHIENDS